MWRHHLLTFGRALTRRPLHAALNIAGLALGLAVFLILWLDVRFETGFERWIPDAGQIYLLRASHGGAFAAMAPVNRTPGRVLDALRAEDPRLEGVREWDETASARHGGEVRQEQLAAVDPGFFRVFELPFVAGGPATALASPDSLVLTAAKARQYFGAAQALGRRLTLTAEGRTRDYRVTGVLADLPANTDLRFDFLTPLSPAGAAGLPVFTWLRFETPAAATRFDAGLDAAVDRRFPGRDGRPAHTTLRLRTLPLTALHLLKRKDPTWPNPRDPAVVAALGAVGVLTALLAALNYVNLATAQAGLRAREAALRKVMGATGPALVVQFLGEALAVAILAGLVALGLTELALPFVDAASGLPLKLHYLGSDSIAAPMLGATLAIGLGAGAYPALVLSRFQPAAVLAAARAPDGGRAGGRLREALVAVQFAVAIAFLIGTAVIAGETRYLRQVDLGWRPGGLIVVDSFEYPGLTEAQHASLLAAWRSLPHVSGVSSANRGPGDVNMGEAALFKRPGVAGDGKKLDFLYVAPGFFDTLGAKLIAGRWLGVQDGLHRPPHAVVLNASAVEALGFKSRREALGRTVLHPGDGGGEDALTVVGVSADMRFHSPKEAVHPSLYYLHADDQDRLTEDDDFLDERAAIRFSGEDPRTALAQVKAVWREIAPDAPFIADTAGEDMEGYYRTEARTGRLFALGAVMATAIACLGLFGLASFSAARRAREIGVRKTLGASSRDLLRLLMGKMLRPVLAASLIAWPAAFVVMRGWLSGFDQRITLGPGYFAAATTLAVAVAGLTVLAHAWRLARAEPGRALREA